MSKLTVFESMGFGTVVENPPIGEVMVNVLIQETSSMRDGELTTNPVEVTNTTSDSAGNKTSTVLLADTGVPAKWLSTNGNRKHPPNVRRGEVVEVYRKGDTGQYYWRETGINSNLRKLETVIFGISGTPNEGDDGDDPENMYWLEWSSHSKRLMFTNSQKNGEPYKYVAGFNFEDGEFSVEDDVGNSLALISALSQLFLKNNKGSSIELKGKNINVVSPDMVHAKSKNINVECGERFHVSAGGSTFTVDGSGITWKAPKFTGN